MQKIEITKRQKKIFKIAGIVVSAFAVFIIFIYIPAEKKLARLKSEYLTIQAEINEFNKSIGEDKPLEEVILSLKNRLEALDKKFPEKEEVVFRELSTLAENLGIEVLSVRPEKKRVINEIENTPVSIEGCIIQEMPISMSLRTSYEMLGEFLKNLKEGSSSFIRVDSVRISKTGDNASAILDVSLNLNTYLISPINK